MAENKNLCLICRFFEPVQTFCTKRQRGVEAVVINCPFFQSLEKLPQRETARPKEFGELIPPTSSEPSSPGLNKVDSIEESAGLALSFVTHMKLMFFLFLGVSVINWIRPFLIISTFNRWDLMQQAVEDFILYFLVFILIIILFLYIKYTVRQLDKLFLEKGENSKYMQNLFAEKSFYIKFCQELYSKSFSKYIVIVALVISLTWVGVFLPWSDFRQNLIGLGGTNFIWSFWGDFFLIFIWLLVGATIFLVLLILTVLLRGLTLIKGIIRDRENLAITVFLHNLRAFLFDKDKEKMVKNKNSASYFGFQESNRYIGEFLFKITGFLILFLVLISSTIAILYNVLTISATMQGTFFWAMILVFIFGMITIILFIYPQIEVHNFLKSYKQEIIDLLNLKIEEVSAVFLLSFNKAVDIKAINPKWSTTQDLIDEVEMLMMYEDQMERMGTWSYDFPEVFKLLAVALAPLIPILAALLAS